MKKLTDEGKVLTMFAIIMLWCAITSLSGHSEFWIIPLLTLSGLICMHLILSLIRDIYFAKGGNAFMSADIGKSIKQIREQRDLNQRELAKYAGISNVTVCKIEQGVLTPSLKTTIRIANVLQCSLDDLCGRSRNSRNSRQ